MEGNANTREARAFHRKPIDFPVAVALHDASKFSGVTCDLSMGGISLLMQEYIPRGHYCTVSFEVPLEKEKRKVLALGQIVYSNSQEAGFKTGIQFLDMEADSLEMVKKLLR